MSVASSRSDGNRVSKYAASLTPSDSMQSHYSHASHMFHHNKGPPDEFEFERPADDVVEALFEQVRLKRDLGELPSLSVDQKWQIVYNDEQLRWKEEKVREAATKRQADSGIQNDFLKDSPEWYLKKFLDQTITPKQAASLLVSLRTGTVGYVVINLHIPPLLTNIVFKAGLSNFWQYRAPRSLQIPLTILAAEDLIGIPLARLLLLFL